MLSIKHFVCCGIDVHKKFVVATIAITDYRSVTSYIKGRFATFNSDLKALKKWLLEHNCTEVCMESTGKYWIPVFNILEDSCHVVVANPKYVRAIKGQKTDDKDSAWIADLFKFDIVPSNYIPCKEILALRELFRYRQKLIGHRSSEKNRFQNALTYAPSSPKVKEYFIRSIAFCAIVLSTSFVHTEVNIELWLVKGL